MTEIINNITNQQWFITVVSFLSANFMAILFFLIKMVKDRTKIRRINEAFEELLAERTDELNEEQKEKIEEVKKVTDEKINEGINKVEELFNKAFEKLSDDKKLQIEANAAKLQEILLSLVDDFEEKPEEEQELIESGE